MRRLLLLLAFCTAAGLIAVPPAFAAFGFKDLALEISEEDGSPSALAGSHPYEMSTRIAFNTVETANGGELPDQQVRELTATLPEGLVGDPFATTQCPSSNFSEISFTTILPNCSDSDVVGILSARARLEQPSPGEKVGPRAYWPVYNLGAGPGRVAQLGVAILRVPVIIDIGLEEEAPYNVVASLKNIPQALQLFETELTVWGNPADPSHDEVRGSCIESLIPDEGQGIVSRGSCPVEDPTGRPFLTLPRTCTDDLMADFGIKSWEANPSRASGSATATNQLEECEDLGFSPEAFLQTSDAQADSPTGLNFELDVDDPELISVEPGATADSDIKKTVVTLPQGVALNPAVASGLEACSETDLARETASAPPGAGCPNASKVGKVEVETPLLQDKLEGSLFTAQQLENPFDSLLAVYLVIKDPDLGISIKLPGRVDPDPVTGQLVTTFDDLPQFPFSHVSLQLRRGSRAPLINLPSCGTGQASIEMTAWADPTKVVTSTSALDVTSSAGGGVCAESQPFDPALDAGTTNPLAGSFSPFFLRLSRADGSQRLSGLELTLPEGLSGKLAGVPYCPEGALAQAASLSQPGQGATELAAPSCPSASQVGTATVGAGAGPNPIYVKTGKVYLAGPYKGAPLSFAIVTPAVTGPFDLGNVLVRAALYVDESTGRIRAVSDPIPTILHGIPLDVRDIQMTVDRPGFTLNPTSCDPTGFSGQATSSLGANALLAQRFQVGGCEALPFKPKLSLQLKGGTRRSKHPELRAVLTQKPGQANIDRASVMLPVTEFIDQNHINNPCTRPEFAAQSCPGGSVLGTARAFSPLFDKPLEGKVYFRSNGGDRPLPDIVADLRGQVHIVLVGQVDAVPIKGTEKSRIRNTFATVPDAPVSKFVLRLPGGKRGLLVNSSSLCAKKQLASVRMDGQNGKQRDFNVAIKTSCGKKKKKPGKTNP